MMICYREAKFLSNLILMNIFHTNKRLCIAIFMLHNQKWSDIERQIDMASYGKIVIYYRMENITSS